MITKELFIDYISQFLTYQEAFDRLEKSLFGERAYRYSNLYESDWNMAVGGMLDIFLQSHFTEEAQDWINWWLFEDVKDKKVLVTRHGDLFNKEHKVEYHLNTLEDLWDFLLKEKYLNNE